MDGGRDGPTRNSEVSIKVTGEAEVYYRVCNPNN
jgi:hypothetical protein